MKLWLELGFGVCVLLLIIFNWDIIIDEIKYQWTIHTAEPSFIIFIIAVIILCMLVAL